MINFINRQLKKYRELILYCMIGCTGAALDFIVYASLTRFAHVHYQWANLISVSFGIINNFFLNARFNFRTRDRLLLRFASFYLVGMTGWAISAGCLHLFIGILDFNEIAAKLLTIFIVTAIQFLMNKFITFKKGRPETAPEKEQ